MLPRVHALVGVAKCALQIVWCSLLPSALSTSSLASSNEPVCVINACLACVTTLRRANGSDYMASRRPVPLR